MTRRGRPPYPGILTPREEEVLALLRQGLTNPEIAGRLEISLDGAKYHVSEILSKLGVASREEAARWRPVERKPPWALGGVPLSALWRRTKALSPNLGPVAIALSAGLLVAVIGGLALLAVLVLRGEERRGDLDELVAKVRTAMDDADYRLEILNAEADGPIGLVEIEHIAPDRWRMTWSGDSGNCGEWVVVGGDGYERSCRDVLRNRPWRLRPSKETADGIRFFIEPQYIALASLHDVSITQEKDVLLVTARAVDGMRVFREWQEYYARIGVGTPAPPEAYPGDKKFGPVRFEMVIDATDYRILSISSDLASDESETGDLAETSLVYTYGDIPAIDVPSPIEATPQPTP